MNDFLYREVPGLGRHLHRLGLSGSFGLDEGGCREALERIQYVFWDPRRKELTRALRDVLARDRERYVVSAGPLLCYFPGAVRRAAEAVLRKSAKRGRSARWGSRSTTGSGRGSLPRTRSSISS
jgi:hypothetical protein